MPFGTTDLVRAKAFRSSTPGLASSEPHPCPSPGLWTFQSTSRAQHVRSCPCPAYPLPVALSTPPPSRTLAPGTLPWPASQHPLDAPSPLPDAHCLCLILFPSQVRAQSCGTECQGFLGGEQDGGPGSMGDWSLGSLRWRVRVFHWSLRAPAEGCCSPTLCLCSC